MKLRIENTIVFLHHLQKFNDTIVGILSRIIIYHLLPYHVDFKVILRDITLSPSFYIPENIIQYSKNLSEKDSEDFLSLACQFHSFEAWVLMSQNLHFYQICLSHLETTKRETDFLVFSKHQIKNNNLVEARKCLTLGLKTNSPIILRVLSRLTMDQNPVQALGYARKAVSLGDSESRLIVANILDSDRVPNDDRYGLVSNQRLTAMGDLIALLDPCFAYNLGINDLIKDCNFSRFLAGTQN